jgi:hypothetical protein
MYVQWNSSHEILLGNRINYWEKTDKLKSFAEWKPDQNKRVHTVRFQVYKTLENANQPIVTESKSLALSRQDMYGPGDHYIELNKPDTERQVLLDLTHMWNL